MAIKPKMMIKIQNLSKTVKKKKLLLPLDYQLAPGKILALCGGNGAGKSTLIRLMTGILKPTTGKVIIHNRDLKKHKQQFAMQFGYMPDDFQFQGSFTTKEIIRFYAQIKNISKQRYEEVLVEVGLLDKLHMKVGQFSKGMNQRLLLAQALLAKPATLFLDEPTNGLDPYWIKQFCELMLEAKAQGQTVIFSTHDFHVVEKIADEVLFLQQGEVISKGKTTEYLKEGLYHTFKQFYLNPSTK